MARRRWGSGGLRYRPAEKRWVGSVSLGSFDGKRIRRSYYGRTREEALGKLEAARRRVRAGLSTKGERMTVGDYLVGWLREIQPSVAPSTWVSYEGQVRIHLAPVHAVLLEKLTPQDIRATLAEMTDYSPRTVAYTLLVLRMALKRAVEDELIDKNPADRVRPPRVTSDPPRFWDVEDAKRFLGAIAGDRWEALYKLAIGTGMRKGEIVRLTWADIDLNASSVRVTQSKTAAGRRTVPVPGFALDALRGLSRSGVFVFATRSGRPVDPRNLTRWFDEAIENAGVPRIRFHDLRHSAATLMLAMGVPPRVVQGILGHSKMGITMELYGHVLEDSKRDAAKKMGEALG